MGNLSVLQNGKWFMKKIIIKEEIFAKQSKYLITLLRLKFLSLENLLVIHPCVFLFKNI